MTTTKQEARKPDGTFDKGYKPPTTFADRPQDRNNGAWKKEDTARFKLEQMMKLSPVELNEVIEDKSRPLFEHKLAQAILDGQWREIEGMINQVYGKPKESVDISNPDGTMTPTVRIIDSRISPNE